MTKHAFLILYALTALILLSGVTAALAQQAEPSKPLEISADESLEWDRENQTFTARQNARARQGDMAVSSDILTAHYREGQETDIEIWQIVASGNVVVDSKGHKAYGDMAVYDVQDARAVMTGRNLRMTSPDQTVSAQERFEYWTDTGRLAAVGDATVIRGQDRLRADQLVASFQQNQQTGQRALDTIEAKNNVVIITPTEKLTGAYGIYRADTNIAEIRGGVRITRGPNILTGEKAQLDLTTNISRIFGSEKGRVSGVFYPKSKEESSKEK